MSARLVGRTREQAWMRALLRAPESGRGALALVEGEAGIGKSALLQVMLASARAKGWEVVVATADELDSRRPFALVETALGPVEAEVAAVSGRAHGIARPFVEAGVAETVIARVVARAAQRPLVVALEDVQWSDPASLAVVGRLAPQVEDVPVLVVATARPFPRPTSLERLTVEAVPEHRRLNLDALSAEEVAVLVGDAVAGTPGEGLLHRSREAAGNPLLVLELVTALERAGGLRRVGDVVEAGSLVLPCGPAGAIASRLLSVPPDVRDLLGVAAILGRTFRVADLARVMACPAAQLLGRLRAAQAAGLVEDNGQDLAFRHELIRAALVEDLAPTARRALHLDVARALAAANVAPGRVAEHLARGAEPGDAEAIGRLATFARSLAATSPEDAAGLFELAMSLAGPADPAWAELAADGAVALAWSGRAAEAEQLAAASLGAGAQGHSAARASLTRAHALQGLGRLDEALAVSLDPPSDAQPATRSHALASSAFSRFYLDDRDQAMAEAERARGQAIAAGDPVAACFALHVLVLGHGLAGQFGRAVELAEEAARLADSEPGRAGHRFAGHVIVTGFLVHLDRLAEADIAVAQGRFLAERLGDRQGLAYLDLARAVVCFEAGDWHGADTELATGLSAVRNMGVGWLLAPLGLQALLALHRRDLAAARLALAGTDEARRAGGAAAFTEFATLAQARLLEAEQRPDAALGVLVEACQAAVGRGSAAELPALVPDLVRLALDLGEADRSFPAVDALTMLAAAHPRVPTLAGMVLRCRGLVDGDVDLLLEAVEVHRRGPRPLARALACGEAAAALATSGHHDRALDLLDEARALLLALGARGEFTRVVAATRKAGLRPGRRPGRRAQHGVGALTPAERGVVELIAEGWTNPEIGERLYVSRNTVRTHVSRALAKLGCRTRAELAVAIVREDEPPGPRTEHPGP